MIIELKPRKMAIYGVIFVAYVAVSCGAMYVQGVKPILLFGPTKSLTFLIDGMEALDDPNLNISTSSQKDIMEVIYVHLACWMMFPAMLVLLPKIVAPFRKALLISLVVSWIVGISVNWVSEVFRSM